MKNLGQNAITRSNKANGNQPSHLLGKSWRLVSFLSLLGCVGLVPFIGDAVAKTSHPIADPDTATTSERAANLHTAISQGLTPQDSDDTPNPQPKSAIKSHAVPIRVTETGQHEKSIDNMPHQPNKADNAGDDNSDARHENLQNKKQQTHQSDTNSQNLPAIGVDNVNQNATTTQDVKTPIDSKNASKTGNTLDKDLDRNSDKNSDKNSGKMADISSTDVTAPINAITTQTIMGQRVTLPAGMLEKLKNAHISPNDISILVQPLQGNTPLLSHLASTPRTPASTQKLIPTFIALDTLGADFTWVTHIYQRGWLMNGTLHGDILIKASGDPKMNHERLTALLASLKAQGIQHIDGDIVVDNGIFQHVNFNPNSFDGQGIKAYNAPPNGFLINFGTLQVDFIPSGSQAGISNQPAAPVASSSVTDTANVTPIAAASPITSAASPPIPATTSLPSDDDDSDTRANTFTPNPEAKTVAVRVYPPLADFQVPRELPASQTACGRTPAPHPSLNKDGIAFSGQVTPSCGGQSSWYTFPDSDTFVKKAVKGTWQQFDPTFAGTVRLASDLTNTTIKKIPITETMPADTTTTTRHTPQANFWQKLTSPLPLVSFISVPLAAQIWDINHYSNNVMTEQVTLSLPIYAEHRATSDYPSALAFIQRWWQQHLPNNAPPIMSRGSGLCRDCQVAPASMLALLNYAYHSPNFDTFRTSMGVAGVSGTMKALKKRHPDSPAIGNAWIKTGTLDNVTSMVGYVKGHSGKWYAVVGMVNAPNVGHNDNVKAVLDDMLAWTAIR